MSTQIEPKQIKHAYGYDDIAVVPGEVTINPDMTTVATTVGNIDLKIPIIASAMDSVTSPEFAIKMSEMGGMGVLNLEGIHTRYAETKEIYAEIAGAPREEAEKVLQKVYSAPIKEELIGRCVERMAKGGAPAAVSLIPANTKRYAPLAEEAGATMIVVQSTVTTARHRSRSERGLRFNELTSQIKVPVVVGNTVSYSVTLELMQQGIAGVLVGVGPGAACTSREVLGIGVPQVTSTINAAAARDSHFRDTGQYVPIITDGGIRTGGDLVKSFVAGADAVMIGSPFAKTEEAPCSGYHWGMAAPHAALPRGTRLTVDTAYTLQKLLFGPSDKTNGTENLVTALRTAMGMIGAETLKDMRKAEIIYAPAIKSEGKIYQQSGLAA